jgi:hypothetical protein
MVELVETDDFFVDDNDNGRCQFDKFDWVGSGHSCTNLPAQKSPMESYLNYLCTDLDITVG